MICKSSEEMAQRTKLRLKIIAADASRISGEQTITLEEVKTRLLLKLEESFKQATSPGL